MDPVLCGLLVGWVWMVLMWSCYIVVHRHLARNHCHTCCLFLNPHPTSSFLFSHFPFPLLSFAFFLSSIFRQSLSPALLLCFLAHVRKHVSKFCCVSARPHFPYRERVMSGSGCKTNLVEVGLWFSLHCLFKNSLSRSLPLSRSGIRHVVYPLCTRPLLLVPVSD